MRVSGSNPISLTLVVIGALAAIAAFLLVTPGSPTQAETKFNPEYDVSYCNNLLPELLALHPDPELSYISGTATGGTSGANATLTDNSPIANLFAPAGSLIGARVAIIDGAGSNPVQRGEITANTGSTITTDANWSVAPDSTSEYRIGGVCAPITSTGSAQTIMSDLCVPGPGAACTVESNNANFSGLVTFYPGASSIKAGTSMPVGDKIGGLMNHATLGVIGGFCNNPVAVPFTLYNVALPNEPLDPRLSTNIYTPYPEGTSTDDPNLDLDGDGTGEVVVERARYQKGTVIDTTGTSGAYKDGFADLALGTSDAIQNYPDWLLDIFDPDYVPASPAQDGPRTSIVAGKVDINGDTVIDTEDFGDIDSIRAVSGQLDMDGDGTINDVDDDGTITVPFLAGGGGVRNVQDGIIDTNNNGTFGEAGDPPSGDNYSDNHQNPNDGDLKPLIPLAVYGSLAAPEPASPDWVPLYFAVFSPGQLKDAGWDTNHPFQSFDSALGYPSITILTDVTATLPVIGAINDFCSPLRSLTMLQGVTGQCGNRLDDDGDNEVNDGCPAFGTAEGPNGGGAASECGADVVDDDNDGVVNDGCDANAGAETGGAVRATNPGAAGTYKIRTAMASIRDLDNDGFENSYDTCPLNFNTGDADADGIDDSCDPTLNFNTSPSGKCLSQLIAVPQPGDHDGDCYNNRLDNAPLVANGRPIEGGDKQATGWDGQAQAESAFSGAAHDTPAPDGGPASDAIGDVGDTGTATFPQNISGLGVTDCDGVGPNDPLCTSVTLNPAVGNGQYLTRGLINAICIGGTDADGDGWCAGAGQDLDDGNPDLLGPLGDPPPDVDGDGYDLWIETWLGTDDTKKCSATGAVTHGSGFDQDETVGYYPPDMNDDQVVNLTDINFMAPPRFFSIRGDANYVQRVDLSGDGVINLTDINFLAPPIFFSTCPATIATSSMASPTVITSAGAHLVATGDSVTITGHTGSTPDINGTWTATRIDATTFTIPVNVTVAGTGGRLVPPAQQ